MMIRYANMGDKDAVIAMGAKFYAATHYAPFADYCEASVSSLFDAVMDDGVLMVAEEGGEIAGMVGLAIVPFLFNASKKMACEVLWYVAPTAQGFGIGKMLLDSVEPACKVAGADLIQMIHLESSPPQAAKLYERAGYTKQEQSYMKVI